MAATLGEKRNRDDVINAGVPRKKKRTKAKRKDIYEHETLDLENGINLAIGNMSSSMLADYVVQRTKRLAPDLSTLELEDRRIPGIDH